MCILATTDLSVPAPAKRFPAQTLPPDTRQQIAVDALAGDSVSQLARDHQVSRKFVYQQADHAREALSEAFAPAPADQKVLFSLPVTERWLRRLILALLMNCHSSYRGVIEVLRDVVGVSRSLGSIHNLARAAMKQARAINETYRLDNVRIGTHDEIFQRLLPVLVGADADSTFCYLLSQEEQRDGTTWGVHLLDLKERGFHPQAIVSDNAKGLLAGHEQVLPEVPHRSDVFHMIYECTPLVHWLETQAYQALQTCVQLEVEQARYRRKKLRLDARISQRLRLAKDHADKAVALADDVAILVGWLQYDLLAVAGPSQEERLQMYDFVVEELHKRASQCPKRLKPLCTYMRNQRDVVLAFAGQLDIELENLAASFELPLAVVRLALATQQMPTQDGRRWRMETQLRKQASGRFEALQAAVTAVATRTVRASSVVENLNSRLRNYFFLRRHLGSDYLQLLQFFLNHHRFERSERSDRVGKSPAELLTGQPHSHWLDLLGYPDPLRN